MARPAQDVELLTEIRRPDHGTAETDAVRPLHLLRERNSVVVRDPLVIVECEVVDSVNSIVCRIDRTVAIEDVKNLVVAQNAGGSCTRARIRRAAKWTAWATAAG